jgi:hypothetical protein
MISIDGGQIKFVSVMGVLSIASPSIGIPFVPLGRPERTEQTQGRPLFGIEPQDAGKLLLRLLGRPPMTLVLKPLIHRICLPT